MCAFNAAGVVPRDAGETGDNTPMMIVGEYSLRHKNFGASAASSRMRVRLASNPLGRLHGPLLCKETTWRKPLRHRTEKQVVDAIAELEARVAL